tara:strand:- start:801 stop:1037 length:237 start_codon:yes stop_codon:yes gene_type:complete
MDFQTTIANATKRTILLEVIESIEPQVFRCSWAVGIDPADLSDTYTAPADSTNPAEEQLEKAVKHWKELKAQRDAISE